MKALLLVACMAPVGMSAQTIYDFQDLMFDYGGASTNMYGVFYHASANGKYAVGYDEDFVPKAYIWRAEKPAEIDELWGDDDRRVSACDVSNDGMVVGSWEDLPADDYQGVCYPAYMTPEGEWKALPVPENYSEKTAIEQYFVNEARAVTPDGRFIAGNIKVVTGFNETWGWDILSQLPCLWENGELKAVYDDLGIKTFQVWDISNDGSTIVGMNVAECGGFNPAIIKNGELINIFQCDADEYEDQNFNGGVANSIDAEGNVYGYFMEGDGVTMRYFKYTPDGEIVYLDDWVVCAGGGKRFGQYNPLPYVLDCSEDGSVVVGGGMVSVGFGVANVPQVAVYDVSDGISRPVTEVDGVGIDWRGRSLLTVKGDYSRADVYSTSGALLMSGGQGRTFNLSRMPNGTYIVKVTTANGVKSFKVAK